MVQTQRRDPASLGCDQTLGCRLNASGNDCHGLHLSEIGMIQHIDRVESDLDRLRVGDSEGFAEICVEAPLSIF